jgi:hypothetical protein
MNITETSLNEVKILSTRSCEILFSLTRARNASGENATPALLIGLPYYFPNNLLDERTCYPNSRGFMRDITSAKKLLIIDFRTPQKSLTDLIPSCDIREQTAVPSADDEWKIQLSSRTVLIHLFIIVDGDVKKTLQCVVLNACYAERQAEAISKYVPCVIGMSSAISDEAAIIFAASFYLKLYHWTMGTSINDAFELDCSELPLKACLKK